MQEIVHSGFYGLGMEYFHAAHKPPIDQIHKNIIKCDYYVVIIAGMYGSEIDEENISYTQKEYNLAEEHGKKIIGLVCEDIDSLPRNLTERDIEKHNKLLNFISEIKKSHTICHWKDQNKIPVRIVQALLRSELEEKEEALSAYRKTFYESFDAAKIAVTSLVEEELKTLDEVSIKWLGSSMFLALPLIEEIIKEVSDMDRKISLEIVMLSSSWESMRDYNAKWTRQIKGNASKLIHLAEDEKHLFNNFSIHEYSQLPRLTGGLINDKYLVVTYCEWDKDFKTGMNQYHAGKNQRYFYYDKCNPRWERKALNFNEWFRVLKEKSIYSAANTIEKLS